MVIRSFVIDINDSIKVPKTRQLQRAGDRLRRTRERYVDDMYRWFVTRDERVICVCGYAVCDNSCPHDAQVDEDRALASLDNQRQRHYLGLSRRRR